MADMHEEQHVQHHHDKEVGRKILDFVAEHPGTNRSAIIEHLGKSTSTINEHVKHLVADGDLKDGLFLTDAGKRKQIKAHVCIYTERRPLRTAKMPRENYQQVLLDEIVSVLSTKEFSSSLYLDGIDIIMGGEFDIILTLRANCLEPIGSLVTGFLRSHRYVYKTTTLMAWPISSGTGSRS